MLDLEDKGGYGVVKLGKTTYEYSVQTLDGGEYGHSFADCTWPYLRLR
jgi:hypothetical protein